MEGSISVDRGWAWVVLGAAFGCMFIDGVALGQGAYVAELIIEQDLDRSSVALFGSLQVAANFCSGPVTYLSELTSYRLVIFVSSVMAVCSTIASIYIKSMTALYFTFGVIPGICVGTVAVQSLIVVDKYFKKRAALANCLCLSGVAVGTLVLPSLFRVTIKEYGWRSSLYIIAGILAQGCVFAMCMRPIRVKDISGRSVIIDKRELPSSCIVYKNVKFYLFLLSTILWNFSWSIVFVFAQTLFYEHNMTGKQVDLLMSLIGGSNLLARLISGLVMNIVKWNADVIYTSTIVCLSLSLVAFVALPSLSMFALASASFGMSYGCGICTQSLVATHIIDVTHYGIVFSWNYFAGAFGSGVGPFVLARIYNKTQSFSVPFFVFAGIGFLSALVMLLVICLDRKSCADAGNTGQDSHRSQETEIFI